MIVEAIVITKITAIPIPRAESNFFETPIYGQSPKKRTITKLLIKIELTIITNNLENSIYSPDLCFLFFIRLISPIRRAIVKNAPGGRIATIIGL